MIERPERGEVGDYYFTYIDQVGDGDIRRLIAAQSAGALALFESIPEEQSLHRYAPGEVEHPRSARAHQRLRTAVRLPGVLVRPRPSDPLPSFDQDEAVKAAGSEDRTWRSHVEEFRAVRAATEALFDHLPDAAWMRRGVASGNPFSVRSLAYIVAGHVTHHVSILRARYL